MISEETDADESETRDWTPNVFSVAALSAGGLVLLVGSMCLLGASANHATPKRYQRRSAMGDV